jgi:hypothetical protein
MLRSSDSARLQRNASWLPARVGVTPRAERVNSAQAEARLQLAHQRADGRLGDAEGAGHCGHVVQLGQAGEHREPLAAEHRREQRARIDRAEPAASPAAEFCAAAMNSCSTRDAPRAHGLAEDVEQHAARLALEQRHAQRPSSSATARVTAEATRNSAWAPA